MKRKTLTTALLAGLTGAVGIANISNAVNINPDGLGQVLIYPYYTVRGGNDTLISIVNTTSSDKAVKVRFLEGQNSAEVLDFNLYLSEFDVWTGAVVDDGQAARLFTDDLSCTVPNIPDSGQQFRTFAFGALDVDQTLDRTREGHIEMIEMGVIDPAGPFADVADHGGAAPACSVFAESWELGPWGPVRADGTSAGDPSVGMLPPSGGLFGGGTLINVNGGTDVAYNADAIDAFSDIQLHRAPGSEDPGLSDANSGPGVASSIVFNNGEVVESDWINPLQFKSVSAVYTHQSLMNEYVLDDATLSGTDWVVTFPTKRFHVDPAFGGGAGTAAQSPFTSTWDGEFACEDIALDIYDREENTTDRPLDFSPLPPQGANVLCFETNIITFNNSDVLGSSLSENVSSPFQNGWLRISFTDPNHSMTSADFDTYDGLPATGFAVHTYTNNTLEVDGENVLSNYAGLFGHRADRVITESGT